MSASFAWDFDGFEVEPDRDGLSNVLRVVHWRLTASEPGKVTTCKAGVVTLGAPNPDNFTPYPEISREALTAWVESSFDDIEAFRAEFAAELQPIPSAVQMPAPWEQQGG